MRNASGDSPMCRAHTVVARAAAVSVDQNRNGFIDVATSILGDLLAGRGVDREKVAKAVNEAQWGIGGSFTQFVPDLENVDFAGWVSGRAQQGQAQPPPGQRRNPFAGWHREEAPPPHPDDIEKARAIQKSRVVFGFGPGDTITPEVLRARHRELAKKHHPDRGGSLERMQEINAAADVLSATFIPA